MLEGLFRTKVFLDAVCDSTQRLTSQTPNNVGLVFRGPKVQKVIWVTLEYQEKKEELDSRDCQ